MGGLPRLKLFLRFDRFDRFVSAIVFVPRERYDGAAHENIQTILARAFNGRAAARDHGPAIFRQERIGRASFAPPSLCAE